MHADDCTGERILKSTLEELSGNCNRYVGISKSCFTGPGVGKTKLDKERTKLCQRELETIGMISRNLKAVVTKSSFKERLKTAQGYLQKLKFLIEDVSFALKNSAAMYIKERIDRSKGNTNFSLKMLYRTFSFG